MLFQTNLPRWWYLLVPIYIPLVRQTTAVPLKSQCISWDYLQLPLLAFLSAELDWKPSWRLMRFGDPLCAHSPLRILPPCKSSKVKPWARSLLRDSTEGGARVLFRRVLQTKNKVRSFILSENKYPSLINYSKIPWGSSQMSCWYADWLFVLEEFLSEQALLAQLTFQSLPWNLGGFKYTNVGKSNSVFLEEVEKRGCCMVFISC